MSLTIEARLAALEVEVASLRSVSKGTQFTKSSVRQMATATTGEFAHATGCGIVRNVRSDLPVAIILRMVDGTYRVVAAHWKSMRNDPVWTRKSPRGRGFHTLQFTCMEESRAAWDAYCRVCAEAEAVGQLYL